jgi:NTE family protein
MKRKTGLVLSGGGARGIVHLGIIKALDEMGIHPDVISGTSAGAIAGAFIAAGYSADEILEIVKKGHFFSFSNIALSKAGIFSMKRFEQIYMQYFRNNSFEDLGMPLYIAATDILKAEAVYFSSGNLARSIMASSCIPLFFQPVEYNQTMYVDGGVLNNFPVEPLQGKCEKIIGIYANSIQKEVPKIKLKEIVDRSYNLAMLASVNSKIKSCSLYLEPPDMSRYSLFDVKRADEIFGHGYKYALSQERNIMDIFYGASGEKV